MAWRKITCPKCGEPVRIPWLWVLGLEMIFYCPKCRKPLRIHFMLGALLAGIGWALAFVSLQSIAFFTTEFTIRLAVAAFFPLGFLYAYLLRRTALRWVCRKKKNSEHFKK